MRFIETHLEGAFVVEPELISDERGAFTRTFCTEEFAALGITVTIEQINLSRNHQTGVFRGLHYQIDPHAESKFMRCIRGRTFNVIVDMRPDSATYRCWFGIELDPISHRALVVPEGFANGYQSLEDNTEVLYSTTSRFAPGAERGIRVDDPSIGIELPLPVRSRSEKDAAWPLLEPR
jgi:dTDP-4-dehydrorhamnose 3,5-epimerase